jgi:(1->4)-alpha-D-glucan 1-alpha-D-glucosylmutase
LQLHQDFTFDDAAGIATYLYDLGVTHVYSSPYLQAAPGSMHGYDVVDHQRVNKELGGIEAHKRFSQTLGENGLGQVLDIVPNHMSLGKENRYWWDVLENGVTSRYASFFDIDWQPQEERLRDKVLVPILGDQYGRVLQNGDVKVVRKGVEFQVEAAGQTLPTAPTSLPAILFRAAEYAKSDTLSFLAASFGRLPVPEAWDRWVILARNRDKVVLSKLLSRLCSEEESVCQAIDRSVTELNANLDALDDFLTQQNYRLAYWKTADQQLGYRRFFDVNTLIGLHMEREHVFEETHALIVEWLRAGVLDGIRVDHPDGLRDPLEYFHRLREHVPEGWIIGEKILEPGEYLRENWPIDGTSGYDFMNAVMGTLFHPSGMAELNKIYGEFTGQPTVFPPIAHDKKMMVMEQALGSDVNRLTSLFVEICEQNRNQRDFTRVEIQRAIIAIAACFAIYRTYVQPDRDEITDEDRSYIERAVTCARDNRPDIDASLFEFLQDVLTMGVRGKKETEFVLRFQQFTSPVMAKGVEDTAFYCYNRLIAACEVGGDPGRDGLSVEDFHAYNAQMQAHHPLSMTTLSTHDTKRADDVRARLAVLTEIPREFRRVLRRWSRLNAKLAERIDRNTEYFYYQTLIGAWPIDKDRMRAYMEKATKEAKQQTSWTASNKEFEDGLNAFIDGTLSSQNFCTEVEDFVGQIREAGRVNSLSQTLLKQTSPGVPDLYQGSELWDLSLVDPDNRRPVDYELRRRLLAEMKSLTVDEIARRGDDGMTKLWTLHQSLHLRREHPEWFRRDAGYTPIEARGRKWEHVVAFQRGEAVITITPRHPFLLGGSWADTSLALPEGAWINRLSGEGHIGGTVRLDALLARFPVALLVKEGSTHA